MRRTAAVSSLLLIVLLACTGGSLPPTQLPESRSAVASTPDGTPGASTTPPPGTASTTRPTATPTAIPTERSGFQVPEAPPPVTVRTSETAFDLQAWTYCYGNACVDGAPPSALEDVGDAPRVEVGFPLEDWTFGATFVQAGVDCPRRQSVPLEQTGDGTWVVEPAGPAGMYDVTLFGRGQGDLFVTFRWTTPHDGPMPVPEARLAVLADHDGKVDSYGVELAISGLRATPRSATAEITVRAANGRSLTFEAERARRCWAEGDLYWDGPDGPGLRAARLGPAPFTYDVVVVLDGVRYAAHADWPADTIKGNAPSVRLAFSPALPALP